MKGRRWRIALGVASFLALTGTAGAGGIGAAEAFAKLKALEGAWSGVPSGEGAEADPGARHQFRVAAAGSVVMETMFPGTDHEMINMYHLDGDELVLTHYCAAGNQPTMRLDRAASSADRLVFEFSGGTNLDPSRDQHIHGARLTLGGDRLTSEWTSWTGGKPADTMSFLLQRD